MKKILISLFVIGVVSAVTVGATSAYFTDQAVVESNTFAAGALDFTLNGDMTESVSLTLSDLEPGGDWSGPYKMKIYNKNTPSSTVDMKYRFYDDKESESVSGFYNKLNVKVNHGNCMTGANLEDISPIQNTYTGKLKNLNWDSTTDSIGGGKLSPNITHCFALYFQLDSSAGNEFQGANAVADIVVDGTQFINPGWNE